MTATGTDPYTAPDPRRWVALGVIAVAQLMIVLDASIVNIALPSAQRSLEHLRRQPAVGRHGLRARLRRAAAARWTRRRLHRTQARVRHRPDRLRGWPRPSAASHRTRASCSAPAHCRAAFAALMAPAALSLITVTFTAPRERAKAFAVYGGISGGGAALGPDPRWRAHRVRLVALDPAGQHPHCHRHRYCRPARGHAKAAPRAPRTTTSPVSSPARSAWLLSSTASPRPTRAAGRPPARSSC